MSSSINQEDFQVIDSAKTRLVSLAILQAILWIVALLLPPILEFEFLIDDDARAAAMTAKEKKETPPVSIRNEAVFLARRVVPHPEAGAFFFSAVALLAAFFGGMFGYGKRSWTFIIVGFWMVVANAAFFAVMSVISLLLTVWNLLMTGFHTISKGWGEFATHNFAEMISWAIILVGSIALVCIAHRALRPAFKGVLIVGRAQELDSGLLDFLAPFEGQNRSQVLTLLFRNSLAECVSYALVGHLFILTLFSGPGFITELNDFIETQKAEETEKVESGDTDEGEATNEGEKPEGAAGANATSLPEPGTGLDTPAAKPKSDDPVFDELDDDTKPTGKEDDYKKHINKPEKTDAADDDFLKLD
ncbi:MAG: hypothetical protein QF886_12615 [Planctomycetota bacterium]|nr:hypothetical protein [Planctomycetota bacterium]